MRERQFLIRLAFLNVLTKKFRAFLTIGGIAVSAGIMILLFGLGAGLQHMVTTQITQSNLQNVITVDTRNPIDIPLNGQANSRLRSISGVSSIEQISNVSGQITYNGISLFVPVYGVTGNYFSLAPLTTVKGSIGNSMAGNNHNILLSKGALKAFGLDDSILGKSVKLNVTITADNDSKQTDASRVLSANDFVVKAIVDKGNAPVTYIPEEYLLHNGVDKASELKVQMDYPQHLSTVRSAIERLGYQTSSVQDSIAQVNRIFGIIQSILVVFGIVTVLITVFGTVNTITIQLIEETRQIGFLRIMGIKREDVGLLFILQSIILSTCGALAGIVLGLIGGLVTNGIISAATKSSSIGQQGAIYVYQIPKLPIIIILVLSVAIGWAIGILPSKRAVAVNPIAAMRSQ